MPKYNADACVYLEKVQKRYREQKKMSVNFLAYNSILRLFIVIKQLILEKINENVRKNRGRYSIIVIGRNIQVK